MLDKINKILHTEWNPIGQDVPEDEYMSYARSVHEYLENGEPSRSALIDYLHSVQTVDMELTRSWESCAPVADSILNAWEPGKHLIVIR